MKTKLINIILLCFIISISFSSCSKDELPQVNNNKKNVVISGPNNNLKAAVSSYRILYCEWGWIWDNGLKWGIIWCDCFLKGGNCLPTVVITADKKQAYSNFINSYESGDMSGYFSGDEYKTLFPDIDSIDLIEKLQNGSIKLHQYKCSKNGNNYFFGLPSDIEYNIIDSTWAEHLKFVLVTTDK